MTRYDLRKGPISWIARNPVAANLLMFALLIGGIAGTATIKQEVFPATELDMIFVSVPYPGASPAEVEQGIVLAIEESVRALDGIKEIRSTANEGVGTVMIELTTSADKIKLLSDIKNQIDRIRTFPKEAERPIVSSPEMKRGAISLALYGDQEEKILHEIGEQVRETLLANPGISYVEMNGVKPLEISVEVPQDNLRRYGLTLPFIADKIRQTALESPAGAVKSSSGEIMLRTAERRDLGMDFENIPIISDETGNKIRLSDIAAVKDGFAEIDLASQFDGKPCVLIDVYSVGDQSPTAVAKTAKALVKRLEKTLPPGVHAATWMDYADLYQQRLDLMLKNATIGLFLVLIILGLFLEIRLAFWVTMGIPISFLGSFILLPALGISLNMISMFAFIVTLGMVVDDAIIVGENAFRHRRNGVKPLRAAILGAKEMSVPVLFSILTTIAAFSPLLFIPGVRGKFMLAIPVVSIMVLALSLIESFFILPAHLAHVKSGDLLPWIKEHINRPLFPSKRPGALWLLDVLLNVLLLPVIMIFKLLMFVLGLIVWTQSWFSPAFERLVDRRYAPIIRTALHYRWITLAIGVAILVSSWGLLKGGHVKFIDFPKEESDWVTVTASLPFGSAINDTEALTERLLLSAKKVVKENGGSKISKGIFSQIGKAKIRGSVVTGTHVTKMYVILVSSEQRDIGSHEFAKAWRKNLGEVPELETLQFDSSTGHGETPPIDVRLTHRIPSILEAAAEDLAQMLRQVEGVADVDDGIELGKPQIDFTLTEEGVAAGLTSADIAAQIRGAFYGSEALRQQRGRNEVKVLVKLPRAERESLSSVEELIIRTPSGGQMPLREAANMKSGRAYTTIHRTDGKRTVAITANVLENKANAKEVMGLLYKDFLPKLEGKYPGISLFKAGRQKSNQDFMSFLMMAYILILLVMYAMIAVPLKSYLQPLFVVMMAIPFGFVGAVLGHLMMGINWSMISWMGLVALSGVVVNDSLVLVTAANRFRESGMSALDAGAQAACQRLRPILLTSLTTFGGLAPMIFETSVQAKILTPMAVGLGFGILFATFIILLIVPSLYVMVETPRDWYRSLKVESIKEERELMSEGEVAP